MGLEETGLEGTGLEGTGCRGIGLGKQGWKGQDWQGQGWLSRLGRQLSLIWICAVCSEGPEAAQSAGVSAISPGDLSKYVNRPLTECLFCAPSCSAHCLAALQGWQFQSLIYGLYVCMQAGLRCKQVLLLGKEEENFSSSPWLPGERQALWGLSRDPDTAPQQERIALNLQKQQNVPRSDEGKENGTLLFWPQSVCLIASCPQCPAESPGREQAFLDELKVHINGAGEGCPGKSLSKRKTWNRAERGNGSLGEAGREGCTTTAQWPKCLSPGAGAAQPEPARVSLQLQSRLPLPWGTEEARCAPALLAGRQRFPAETIFHTG